jgi:hypothetical protein
MSIFAVLRYPVSLPPSGEELSGIPSELYKEWIDKSSWMNITEDSSMNPIWVAEWMCEFIKYKDNREEIEDDVQLLRNMIKEYDE